jgi:DNA-binding MarR family transcriptional regulator/ribosomal protein S18 acetylase RimI-like enzyme
MDLIKELGYLAIGSRMKRLTERLMRSGHIVYKSQKIDFEPRWFPVFYLLQSAQAPLSISEIAKTLRLTHPAVIQITQMMTKKGLIQSSKDEKDRRKRQLSLTQKGKNLVPVLEPIWEDFVAAIVNFFENIDVDMIDIIQKIEAELDKREMGERIIDQIKHRLYNAVDIEDFKPEYNIFFKTFNTEWLNEFFHVEEEDVKMFSNPKKEILDKGGFILFARIGENIVGTGALVKLDTKTFEIAKMAVTKKFRGKQAGKRLADALIDKAVKSGAESVVLRTDNKLTAAVNLYRSLGFVISPADKTLSNHFVRAQTGYVMKLDVSSR